jgi:hypothetical protein
MKQLFLITFFAFSVFSTKAQCIRIYVAQKVKGVEIPIERREFEITINDTMKLNLTSTSDGLLGRVSLDKGIYKVKLQSEEYADATVSDVVVEESRSNNLTVNVVPLTAAQIEEKKKPK